MMKRLYNFRTLEKLSIIRLCEKLVMDGWKLPRYFSALMPDVTSLSLSLDNITHVALKKKHTRDSRYHRRHDASSLPLSLEINCGLRTEKKKKSREIERNRDPPIGEANMYHFVN